MLEGSIYAGEHVLDLAQAGHVAELRRVERIEGYVDARESRIPEFRGHLGKQDAVGGERYVLDLRNIVNLADEVHDALAHERLAAGEAHAADARLDRPTREVGNFLDAQDRFVGTKRNALLGHAVYASQVAAVRQGNAQVVDLAPVVVLHVAPS